jgi:hypothetical protein
LLTPHLYIKCRDAANKINFRYRLSNGYIICLGKGYAVIVNNQILYDISAIASCRNRTRNAYTDSYISQRSAAVFGIGNGTGDFR